MLAQARSYARLALVLVVMLGITGLAAAWRLLDEAASLWSTGYGRLILAKSELFGRALSLPDGSTTLEADVELPDREVAGSPPR